MASRFYYLDYQSYYPVNRVGWNLVKGRDNGSPLYAFVFAIIMADNFCKLEAQLNIRARALKG